VFFLGISFPILSSRNLSRPFRVFRGQLFQPDTFPRPSVFSVDNPSFPQFVGIPFRLFRGQSSEMIDRARFTVKMEG
jgi:hypothetical protein